VSFSSLAAPNSSKPPPPKPEPKPSFIGEKLVGRDDDDAAVASRLDTGESLRSGGGVRGPGDDSFGAFADGLTGDSSPVSDCDCPARAPQTSDDAIAVGCMRFVGWLVPPIEGFVGFIATGATRLGGFRGFGSSADAGRASSSFGVGVGVGGDAAGDGGPSSFSSRRRGPSPPHPLPPPPPPGVALLSAPRPAPAGIPSDGNSVASSMSIPGSLLPVLGAAEPHPLARWPPGPRAPSNPGGGCGVGCGGILDADAGGACRALAAAADAAAAAACASAARRRSAGSHSRLTVSSNACAS
jgi:hypothetical protein